MIDETLTREEKERRRLRGIELLTAGSRQSQVALKLGVSRTTVSKWVRILSGGGPEALRSRRACGRPSLLTPKQLERVRELWGKSDSWTCDRFAIEILDEFGIRYHRDHVGRLILKLGLRPSREQLRKAATQ